MQQQHQQQQLATGKLRNATGSSSSSNTNNSQLRQRQQQKRVPQGWPRAPKPCYRADAMKKTKAWEHQIHNFPSIK
eukprot:11540741-Alexandrium_andersonii.AAC.1